MIAPNLVIYRLFDQGDFNCHRVLVYVCFTESLCTEHYRLTIS